MNCWKSEAQEVNGINIHYLRTEGDKPPLVLLHGLMSDGMCCWKDVAHILEEEYDVIMPDARGHGKSSAPEFGYRYDDYADDVLRPPNPDYKTLVSTIDIPSLMVFGDKGVVSSAVAEELQQINPRLQVKRIQNAGQSVHRDQLKIFTQTVKSFCTQLPLM